MPPGLLQQALRCVWEREARHVILWKDLDGIFTSGLMTEREAEPLATDIQGAQPSLGAARPQRCSLFRSCRFLCLGHLLSSTGSRLSFNSAWDSLLREPSLTLWVELLDFLRIDGRLPGGGAI